MARPLVTIGLSTYNRADGYLQDALAAIEQCLILNAAPYYYDETR